VNAGFGYKVADGLILSDAEQIMIGIRGAYNTAVCYCDELEDTAEHTDREKPCG
jgi:hypothetical protein